MKLFIQNEYNFQHYNDNYRLATIEIIFKCYRLSGVADMGLYESIYEVYNVETDSPGV